MSAIMKKPLILICLFLLLFLTLIEAPTTKSPDPNYLLDVATAGALAGLITLVSQLVWSKLSALLQRTKAPRKENEHTFFFGIKLKIVAMVAFYIAMVSVLTGAMFLFRSQEQFFFDLATAIIISWVIMVIIYYIWAIFFYNVNMGWDEEDWENLKQLKEDGEPLPEDEPMANPHANETLGLPPGTVRGTLAITLLIAGLAMLIASFQLDQTYDSNALFVDNFEFIKTAFLMMIAFYFGDKSIKALSERNQGVYRGAVSKEATNTELETPKKELPSGPASPVTSHDATALKKTLQTETVDDGDYEAFNEKGSVG